MLHCLYNSDTNILIPSIGFDSTYRELFPKTLFERGIQRLISDGWWWYSSSKVKGEDDNHDDDNDDDTNDNDDDDDDDGGKIST